MSGHGGLRGVDVAVREVLARTAPLSAERVPLHDAVGRVLRESVTASGDLPSTDDSAMDGYAVCAADVPAPGVALRVSGEVRAGAPGDVPLPRGTAMRIFTGAPLPPGADAVLIQEDATRDGDLVCFHEGAVAGRHVRRRGSDVRAGEVVLSAGRALRAADVSLLATFGRAWVAVTRRPVVAVAASGDELVEPDAGPAGPGRVVNGNAYGLCAAIAELGCVPRLLPLVSDDPDATRRALADAARSDALVTTGGMSVGDYDFVRDALRALSGDTFGFWKVAIKPGKPFGFGQLGPCLGFGLPGNPVSALVTFEVFVRPALLRLAGHERVVRAPVPVRLRGAVGAGGDRQEYLRATVRPDGDVLWADVARRQGSGALAGMAGADALVVVPPRAPARAAGDPAAALLLGPDDPATRLPDP